MLNTYLLNWHYLISDNIFFNYIMRLEVNAYITSEFWYATTNRSAIPPIDEQMEKLPSIFPTVAIVSHCEFFDDFEDIGEFTPNITGALRDIVAKNSQAICL